MADANSPNSMPEPHSSPKLYAFKLGWMSLLLLYFNCLILKDIWSAIRSKPRTWWIPGKALILSALSIQVLSYLDYSNISFSDAPNPSEVAMLLGNQLVIDSGRLVICVFIGYLLPGMAIRGSAEASSDIVALVVSLFAAIISEIFFVHKAARKYIRVDYGYVYQFFAEWEQNREIKVWFIVSSSVFLVGIVLLILFLISAIIAGKTVRCMMKQRISSVISFKDPQKAKECWETFDNEAFKDPQKAKECWEIFDNEVIKAWLLCRAAQPQYVIARSVLSSSTGLVVTASIVLFVAKTLKLRSNIISVDDGLDWLRYTTFGLQCLFVALGGFVIFRRWIRAVIYFPLFFKKQIGSSPPWPRCSVEDFWTRSVLELINTYDVQQWRRNQKPKACGSCFFGIFTRFKLHKLLYSIWALQKLLVWFSKGCRLFSEMFFGSMLIRRVFIGSDMHLFYDRPPLQEQNSQYEALERVCMPGENPASLWLTNKDSIDQAVDRIKEGKKSECLELMDLLKKRTDTDNEQTFILDEGLPLVKEYFPTLNEIWWMMAAVSLLKIISEVETDGDKREEAIKAYKQAWDLMSFVESSNSEQLDSVNVTRTFDIEADLISMVADKELKILEKRKDSSHEPVVANTIKRKLEESTKQLQDQKLLPREGEEIAQGMERPKAKISQIPQDSKDWNKLVPVYSMYRVCKKLQSREVTDLEDLRMCLRDVIADCVEHLPNIIVRTFGEWTTEHQEDKMWEAFHIVGKCKQVMHDGELKPKWMTSEQIN